MGKRSRRRGAQDAARRAESEYRSAAGDVLVLRGAMTPATRREYAAAAAGSPLSREDAWQRAVEFLFERLAVRWEIAGTEPITRQKELLGRFRFATPDERRWIRDVLREHLGRALPRAGRAVIDARRRSPRLLCGYCLDAQPGQQVVVRSTHARRAAAARASSASCSSAAPGRCCGPSCPARPRTGGPPRATRTSTRFAPAELAEAEETDASLTIQAPENTTRAGGRRPGADGPRRPRARADPRGRDAAALVRDAVADARRRPAGRHGHGRVRRRSSAARRSSTATTRPPPGASCARMQARADRAARRRARAAHRGRGHRPAAQRRRPHLGQLRRQAQHALRRGLHRAGRGLAPRAASASRSRRARAASRSPGSSSSSAPAAWSTRAPSAARSTCSRRSTPTRARAASARSGSARTPASTARSARSCSTRRSAAPSTSRSAAPIPRPAARTRAPCTGT